MNQVDLVLYMWSLPFRYSYRVSMSAICLFKYVDTPCGLFTSTYTTQFTHVTTLTPNMCSVCRTKEGRRDAWNHPNKL